MPCNKCKQKNIIEERYKKLEIRPYQNWTKKMIQETALMYETILPSHKKSLDDWKVIFDIHQYVFLNTSISDYSNNRLRLIVYENLQRYYVDFKILKDKKGY